MGVNMVKMAECFQMIFDDEIICVYSDLIETELEKAPQNVKDYFLNLPKGSMEFVEITDEAFKLAKE